MILPKAVVDTLERRERPAVPIRCSYKALVVDDESEVRAVLVDKLEASGVICYQASNGKEAYSWLKENVSGVDFLVTDYKMPGWSGLDLICKVKTDSTLQHLPILGVTGGVNLSEEEEAITTQTLGLLRKPFSDGELHNHLDMVNRYLLTYKVSS